MIDTAWFVPCALLLSAIVILFFGVRFVLVSARINWLKVTGKITQSKIEEICKTQTSSYLGEYFVTSKKYTSRKRKIIFEYEYSVNNVVYSSSRIYSVPIFPLRIKDILPFTFGSRVEVFYCPKRPELSYIKSSSRGMTFVLGFFAFMVLVFLVFQLNK